MSEQAISLLISIGIIGLLIVWVPCLQILDRHLKAFVTSRRRSSNRDSPTWAVLSAEDVAKPNRIDVLES